MKNPAETDNKKTAYFDEKKKLIYALAGIGTAILWLILWQIFPMEFYSLFFASIVGNNVTLLLLSLVITFPANYIGSKALKADVPMKFHIIVNVIGMIGCVYLYSIFRYTAPVYPVLCFVVHTAAGAIVFTKSRREKVPKIKDNSPHPIKAAVCGGVCTICSDLLYLLLFTAMLNIFRE